LTLIQDFQRHGCHSGVVKEEINVTPALVFLKKCFRGSYYIRIRQRFRADEASRLYSRLDASLPQATSLHNRTSACLISRHPPSFSLYFNLLHFTPL
jgi:hypothetical protein